MKLRTNIKPSIAKPNRNQYKEIQYKKSQQKVNGIKQRRSNMINAWTLGRDDRLRLSNN